MPRELPTMHDVVSPDSVEIAFSANGRTMWLNVDGVCYLRVTNAALTTCDTTRFDNTGAMYNRKEHAMPQGGET